MGALDYPGLWRNNRVLFSARSRWLWLAGRRQPSTMGAVRGAKGIVDVDVAEFAEAGTEGSDFGCVRFDFIAVGVFGFAFFFDVKAEVFKQDNAAWARGRRRRLRLRRQRNRSRR